MPKKRTDDIIWLFASILVLQRVGLTPSIKSQRNSAAMQGRVHHQLYNNNDQETSCYMRTNVGQTSDKLRFHDVQANPPACKCLLGIGITKGLYTPKEEKACNYAPGKIQIKTKNSKSTSTHSTVQTAAVTIISYKPLSDLNYAGYIMALFPFRVYKPLVLLFFHGWKFSGLAYHHKDNKNQHPTKLLSTWYLAKAAN